MNNNESLNMSRDNASDLSDSDCAAMTAEELQLYREVLEAAYPKPARDIKAGVMTAVRRDAAMKKKRSAVMNRSLILKWGGLAASIVLVAVIGIRVLPSFLTDSMVAYDSNSAKIAGQAETSVSEASVYTTADRSEKTAAYDDSTAELTAEEAVEDEADEIYAAYSVRSSEDENVTSGEDTPAEAMLAAYSAETPAAEPVTEEAVEEASAEAMIEEEAVVEEAVVKEAVVEEAVAEEAVAEEAVEEAVDMVVPQAESVTYSYTADDDKGLEIVAECNHTKVFGDSYHVIPEVLIDEVGEGEYIAWTEEVKSAADPCTVSIRSFIDYFELPEKLFEMHLASTDLAYIYDYPLDVLYGDPEKCESYYADGGSFDRMIADNFEYTLKLALKDEISDEDYEAWLTDFSYPTIRAWSISEFVTDHKIPEYRFLEIYNDTAEDYKAEHGVDELHGYDTVKLYVSAVNIKFALAISQNGYQADVSCRK